MGMRLQLYCDYFENNNCTISQHDMLTNLGFSYTVLLGGYSPWPLGSHIAYSKSTACAKFNTVLRVVRKEVPQCEVICPNMISCGQLSMAFVSCRLLT